MSMSVQFLNILNESVVASVYLMRWIASSDDRIDVNFIAK